jgi:DNA-binding MarR family transcriptional regulator
LQVTKRKRSEITDGEKRLLIALCAKDSPLGVGALGLSRLLGVARNTVSTVAATLEKKGFCTRERVGMRIYLRPTPAGLALATTPQPHQASNAPRETELADS